MTGGISIEVEDERGGIAESKIGELFGPFARGRADAGGLGRGLAITREAVEAHGGRIHVRNLPGKGCIFVIDMPNREAGARRSPGNGRPENERHE